MGELAEHVRPPSQSYSLPKTPAVASSPEARYLCQINTIPLALLFVVPTAIATATAAQPLLPLSAQRSGLTPQVKDAGVYEKSKHITPKPRD
jgi:hypothetical protein